MDVIEMRVPANDLSRWVDGSVVQYNQTGENCMPHLGAQE